MGKHIVAGILAFLLALPITARGQMAEERADGTTPAGSLRAAIDEFGSGARWLLYAPRNGGPGRWVRVPTSAERDPGSALFIVPRPVIRSGDRVVVEEHTSKVDGRLEAVALSPAVAGGALRVRLAIGGRVISAVAVSRGRALLMPEEGQP